MCGGVWDGCTGWAAAGSLEGAAVGEPEPVGCVCVGEAPLAGGCGWFGVVGCTCGAAGCGVACTGAGAGSGRWPGIAGEGRCSVWAG
ncbi:hypothetical protein, partial [Enterovirga sp.]|uniref:hypothetical protein n=1 Tax=Enterovirga sp. TaxID=2026350 RepID=UPI00260E3A3A